MRIWIAALLAGALAIPAQLPAQGGSAAQPMPSTAHRKIASTVDQAVLQALLDSSAVDEEFPSPKSPEKTIMVLHLRNPEASDPILNTALVSADTAGKLLPHDAWNDLVRRNVIRREPSTREVFYEGLSFGPGIVVADAFPEPKPPLQGNRFTEVYPQARGFLAPWLPGYSADGKTAVVRARVGPVEKLATLTAILKKQPGGWKVVWRRYSVYS